MPKNPRQALARFQAKVHSAVPRVLVHEVNQVSQRIEQRIGGTGQATAEVTPVIAATVGSVVAATTQITTDHTPDKEYGSLQAPPRPLIRLAVHQAVEELIADFPRHLKQALKGP